MTERKQWKKKSSKELNIQIYCSKELPEDFKLLKNPYLAKEEDKKLAQDGEKEIERLRKMGVLFYRDEDNTNGAFFEAEFEPLTGFYYQFSIFKGTGGIAQWWSKGTRARINWMTAGVVNRDFLEAVKSG